MRDPLIRLNEAGVFFRILLIWIQTALGVVALSLGAAEYARYRGRKTFRMLLEGSFCIFIWLTGYAALSELDFRSAPGIAVRMASDFCAVYFMAICVSFSARVSDIPRQKRRLIASVFYLLAGLVWIALSLRHFLPVEKAGELPLTYFLWGRLVQTVFMLLCAGVILGICREWKKRLRFKRQELLQKKLSMMAVAIIVCALADLLLPVILRADYYALSSLAAFLAFLSMVNVALARKRNKCTMQNAFSLLLQNRTDMPILVIGAENARIEECNEKTASILQKGSRDIPGHSLDEFFDSGVENEEWERRLESDIRIFYCRAYCKNTRIPWQMTVYNIQDSFEEAFLGLIILHDISGEEEMLRELNRTRNAAMETARLNAEFVNGMGGQMRESLKELVSLSSVKAENPEEEALSRQLEQIHNAASTLLFRVNEALDYSRVDAGKAEMSLSEYEPLKLVNEVADHVRDSVRSKGLEFIVCINPSMPSKLKGDAARIKQALSILLENAVKYTGEGYISLTVDYEYRDNGIIIMAEVADSGEAIPQERHVKLFDDPGHLYSARKLAELMDGSINVKNGSDSGNVFTMILPQEIIDHSECLNIPGAENIISATFLKPGRTEKTFSALLTALGIHNIRCTYPPEVLRAVHNGAGYIFVDEEYIEISHVSGIAAPGAVTVVVLQDHDEIDRKDDYRYLIMPEFGMELKALFGEKNEQSGIS